MIPFYLITGFLGSGKTTLLQQLLSDVGSRHKTVVIQNEFASTGIDGITLKRTNPDFELIEMNNGSVFCVCLLSNFVTTLHTIIEKHQPEIIFLEASGLADPINVAELLQHENLKGKLILEKVITVVDAVNFERCLQMMNRFKHQIMIADTVIINKTDLNTVGLPAINAHIKTIAPFAQIIETEYCAGFHLAMNQLPNSPNALRHTGLASEGKPEMVQTCVVRTTEKISREALTKFIETFTPLCLRLKGFVNLTDNTVVSIQSTFDQTDYVPFTNYHGPSELIAFSTSLTSTEFRKAFLNLTHNETK